MLVSNDIQFTLWLQDLLLYLYFFYSQMYLEGDFMGETRGVFEMVVPPLCRQQLQANGCLAWIGAVQTDTEIILLLHNNTTLETAHESNINIKLKALSFYGLEKSKASFFLEKK